VVAPVRFSVVNFRYQGTDEENQAILNRVNATGEAFISSTVLNGRLVMHLAIGNRGTTERHVRRAWELISSF